MNGETSVSQQYREKMNSIAKALDRQFNGTNQGADRKIGFGLVMFPFGENVAGTNRVNWISNAKRHDMLEALKELITRWEADEAKEAEPDRRE